MMSISDFIQYVEGFYGTSDNAVYPLGATTSQVIAATEKHIIQVGIDPEVSCSFCGDSVDREKVRDIMIEDYGLVWPCSALVPGRT